MHEPLTTELVADMMRELLTAFPSRLAGQNLVHTAEVYRNGLRGISGEAFRAAVDLHIKTGEYFPKVARLRELASEWTKRNRIEVGPTAQDDGSCVVCHAKPAPRDRWRPAVGRGFVPIVRDGFVFLEPFVRDLCACAPPCWYAPMSDAPEVIDGRSLWKMRVDDVQRDYKRWLEQRSETRGARRSEVA